MKYMQVVVTLICLSFGLAQPLAALAPADAVLSLGWTFEGGVYDTIDDDIRALDWSKGKVALEKLLNFLASRDGDFSPVFEVYQGLISGNYDQMSEALYDFCPAFRDFNAEMQAQAMAGEARTIDALLTVSISGMNPMPAVTALFRADPKTAPMYDQMREIFLSCAREAEEPAITELEQDGVTLYVLDDAGDFPLVAGNIDNLYFIGSSPDVVRSIVRKAKGTEEASLAGTTLFQTAVSRTNKTQNSATMTADFAAIADALDVVKGFTGDDPVAAYALKRLDSMLRTLGGWAGHISVTPEGLHSEGVFATNPEGGDAELLKLINCTTCKISSPFLAPEHAISVTSSYLPIRELFAYADDWVRGLSEAAGEPTNIKTLLKQMDVDIDTLLLNWIGSEAHTFVLEPFSTDSRQLLYGQPQVTVMPVSSPEAAQAGLNLIGQDLWEILPRLMNNGLSASDLAGLNTAFESFAVREYDYKGTTIHRVQFSFNGDLGYAFVGNYMVLGTPARAIEAMIDTYQGGRTILETKAYQDVRARAPEQITTFSYSLDKPNLMGLADLLELVSQPLAFAVTGGFMSDFSSNADYAFEAYPAYLEGYTAEALEGSGQIDLEITPFKGESYLTRYYELTGLNAGAETTLHLSSSDRAFYPYISLINVNTERYIAQGQYQDDGGDQITFTPEEGVTYWLEVTGSVPGGFSPYSAELAGYTAEPLTVPSKLELGVTQEDVDQDGYVIKYYQLSGLSAGSTVFITTTGDSFSPYLSIIDVERGQYVAASSYQPDGSYGVRFTAEEGVTYWLEVYGSLYDDSTTFGLESQISSEAITQGPLPLTLVITSGDVPESVDEPTVTVEAPTYTELLEAAELLPQLVRVIAEHAGISESYSQIDGNVVYTKSLSTFKW